MTVLELVAEMNLAGKGITAELNGEIVLVASMSQSVSL
jgi:sulfur carrier protein ThiS